MEHFSLAKRAFVYIAVRIHIHIIFSGARAADSPGVITMISNYRVSGIGLSIVDSFEKILQDLLMTILQQNILAGITSYSFGLEYLNKRSAGILCEVCITKQIF